MNSTNVMLWLILNYVVIALLAVKEGNWPRALYFVGAIVISAAVLWMPRLERVA